MRAAVAFAAMLATCVAPAAGADASRSAQGKIIRYGIYRVPSGLLVPTDRVPMTPGKVFGIEFSVFGLPYERVEIICRARHPLTKPDGNGVNSEDAFARRFVTIHGRLTEPYYRLWLRRKSMLIEGTWTLSCSYGDQVLVSKDFFLFYPE